MRKLGEHLDLPQTSRDNPVKWHREEMLFIGILIEDQV